MVYVPRETPLNGTNFSFASMYLEIGACVYFSSNTLGHSHLGYVYTAAVFRNPYVFMPLCLEGLNA